MAGQQAKQPPWSLDGWDLGMLAIAATLVVACPFTKVEESFNVQATHDILYHKWNISRYDHFEFPGVVPRTFIGAFVLASLAFPAVQAFEIFRLPHLYSLYTVRILLGSLTVGSLILLRRQISKSFGREAGQAFALLTLTQFHLLFYASRTLPNTFALILANVAYSFWLGARPLRALQVLVFATVVFRCDILILLGPIGLQMLLSRTVTFWRAFWCCLFAGITSLVFTVALDSLMWQRLIWPEGHVLFFNTVLNKSSDWGVSPPHWYFTSALPRALLGAYFLLPVGLLLDQRLLKFVIPVLSFVILYSFLPHKELRFIFPAIPILNLTAAVAVTRIRMNKQKPKWRVAYICSLGFILLSILGSMVFFSAAYHNYPGGKALLQLHTTVKAQDENSVHIDVLPAMTGISRFLELSPPWRYSKAEGILPSDLCQHNFTYLLSSKSSIPHYDRFDTIKGFSRVRLHRQLIPLQIELAPQVYIHRLMKQEDDAEAAL